MASPISVVTIKKEPVPGGDGPSGLPVLLRAGNNNNGSAKSVPSCFLHIVKEEPPDDDGDDLDDGRRTVVPSPPSSPSPVAGVPTVPGPGPATFVVSAEGGIVIKTEVLDEADELNVDVVPGQEEEDDDQDDDGLDEDSECDFDDDDDDDDDKDEDYEMESSESAETPDSGGSGAGGAGRGALPHSKLADLPEKEEEPGSFDFNGMTIETAGNYSKCPRCLKNIKSTFIIRHIKLHDAPSEKYECPEKDCNLQVNRINNLFRHLREIHQSKKPYVCKSRECGARFAKAQQLKSHTAKHRAERRRQQDAEEEAADAASNRTYVCEFPGCGKEYRKRHHLKEHERKHTGDMKYACEVCGKRFYMQAHMKRHLYSHTGIKPHVCRWKCGAIFASYGGRMKHERINHYEQNPLRSQCHICGRPFKNQQQLSKHRMTHLNPDERRDYRCSFCHIMFDTIKLRERHEERHRDGEVFACESCQKVFKNEKNLSHHIKTHHTADKKASSTDAADSKPSSSQTPKVGGVARPPRPKKDPPPKHHCHLCGPPKLFCLTSLRRHLARIHSTNFKCPREDCGKFFKEKAQLDAHVQIHRLRECHLCGKRFQRKQNADIHLLGVHNLTKEDLAKLGRWNPKKDPDQCPEYMTRKANTTIKKGKQQQPQLAQTVGGFPLAGGVPAEPLECKNGGDEEEEEEEIEGPHELIIVTGSDGALEIGRTLPT